MAHDQIAAGTGHREGGHQGRYHAVGLFRVAMRFEESALLVDQHFVEFGFDRFPRQSETVGRSAHQVLQDLLPGVAQPNLAGADLPAIAHGGVDDGFFSLAVGRLGRLGDQRIDLRRRDRKTELPGFSDLQFGHRRHKAAVAAIVSWPVHQFDELCQSVEPFVENVRLGYVVEYSTHARLEK